MIGQTVANYQIQAKLGEGGMGIVFAAEHVTLGRRVALKMLLPEYSAKTEMVTRFFAEARTAASIEHPGMVDVYDFGHHSDGCAYIVMEFLEGETLTRFLARQGGALAPELVMALGRQIAGAVGAAHQKGITHRDLKPDNVYLVPDAEVSIGIRAKVLDFGIAKLTSDAKPGTMRTKTGVIMGTPIYMSPEQCRGAGHVDSRADIYSLGCILYELVCGHPPFESDGVGEIIAQQLYGQPPPLASIAPQTPRQLEAVIMRCLAKNPQERPQTMEEVAVALGGTYATHPPVGPKSHPLISVRTNRTHAKRPLRTGIIIGASALVVGIAAAVVAGNSGGGSSATAAVEPVTKEAPPPPPAPDPAPAPPLPSTVKLSVSSEPAGAEVYRAVDGVKLGVTPLVHEMQRGQGLAVFIVKLGGHDDARVELPVDRDGGLVAKLVAHPVATPPPPPPPAVVTVRKTSTKTALSTKTTKATAPATTTKKKSGINDGAIDPFAQ